MSGASVLGSEQTTHCGGRLCSGRPRLMRRQLDLDYSDKDTADSRTDM